MKDNKYYPANGTDGDIFTSNNCDKCYKQHQCTILLGALIGNEPKQWIYNEQGKPSCTSFNPNRPTRKKKIKTDTTKELF